MGYLSNKLVESLRACVYTPDRTLVFVGTKETGAIMVRLDGWWEWAPDREDDDRFGAVPLSEPCRSIDETHLQAFDTYLEIVGVELDYYARSSQPLEPDWGVTAIAKRFFGSTVRRINIVDIDLVCPDVRYVDSFAEEFLATQAGSAPSRVQCFAFCATWAAYHVNRFGRPAR